MSVCVALVIQHAMRMRHIVISGLPLSTIFFQNYLINGTISEKGIDPKFCDLFSIQFYLKHFSFQEELSEI
jgi:hypothetical protein